MKITEFYHTVAKCASRPPTQMAEIGTELSCAVDRSTSALATLQQFPRLEIVMPWGYSVFV